MSRIEVLNQLREDLIEALDEISGISRNKTNRRKITQRIVALRAEASTIRAMIRHLERKAST